jgi:TonB-linked SusC/RagA family outer membrane protein
MRWGWLNSNVVTSKRPSAWRRLGIAALAAVGIAGVSGRLAAQATTATITGVVSEAGTNSPLIGASVRVTGTQIGAQTGDDGKYTVRGVQPGTVDLQINRIGYEVKHQRVTVTAGQTATVNVTLAQAAFSLAEVVTTVTGAQSKAEISNTVATIDVASKIPEAAVTSTGQLLSGRASGVQVLSSGDVGSGSRVRIRGQSSLSLSNDPIVYIDGVRADAGATNSSGTGGTQQSALDMIAPEEIETIDVIKGPAAATLYGTQAANGVILITTKKGRAGATKYNAFAEAGSMYDPNKGKYDPLWVSFDTTKPLDKNGRVATCTLQQDAAGSCAIDSTYHGNVLNDPVTTPLANGNREQYGLQISGGAEKLQYFVSGDFQHEQGPYKMPAIEVTRLMQERGTTIGADQLYPNAHKQVNLRTNLNSQFTSKADLNLSVAYIDNFVRQPQNNDNSTGLMVDALGGTARTDLTDARGVPLHGYRSYPMGDIFAQRQTYSTNRFVNGLTTHYYPFSWLNARANFGYDYESRNETYLQEYNQGPFGDTNRQGFVDSRRGENAIYTLDGGVTATYSPRPKFGTKTSFGVQYYRSYFSRTSGTGQGLTPGATTTSGAAIRASSQSTQESITLGGYGEEVLSYAERIFLTGGLRYDGNSAFGSNFSGVFYPKIGISWLLSDEGFFPKFDALNSFRVRATYGSSGVQPGTADALRYYSAVGANINGTENSAVTLGALGNSNLKPEYSGEFEAGFDATAFQNRTTIELTYYNKKTKDALINAPLAPSLGGSITSQLQNLGSTRNQGLELTWNQSIIDNNQVGLEFQLTGSTNKNEILALGEGITPIATGNRSTQYNAPGYPLFGLWGKQISYNDANGDGLLVPSEVSVGDTAVFWGPSFPTHEFAFSPRIELLHRKLAVSAQFDHKDGMTKFWNTLRHRCQGGQSCPGLWNPDATLYQQAAAIAVNSYSTYSGYFFNGAFTRFRELAVSYELPEKLAHALHTDRAQIIGTGRNLAVWTPYPGTDPEAGVGIGDQRGNEEYFSTPPLRFFTLRLNLNF